MPSSRRSLIRGLAATFAGVPALATAQEAPYPNRPIRLLIPYPATGTSPDLYGRIFAEAIGPRLGQRLVVENRPGAGGTIGAAVAARAVPDGYTILWAAASLFQCNPFLYRNIQYRYEDFTILGCFSDAAFVLYARRGLGVSNLPELIAKMRREPGRVTYANGGIGSQNHLTWERLQRVAEVEGLTVPFQTGGTIAALLSGTADLNLNVIDPQQLQYYSTGELVPLAVTSETRMPQLPHVANFIESGFPGFTASGGYTGFVPRGTPEPIVKRLRDEFDAVTGDPAIVTRLDSLAAMVPPWRRAADYDAWFQQDRELWRRIIQDTGITLG